MSEEKVNALAELIEKGKEKGSLSEKEIERVFEAMDADTEQLDKFYEEIDNIGILITKEDGGEQDFVLEIESEVEKYESAEDMEKMLVQEGLSIDDPVRMYLKEIGKVTLLDAEKEWDLAKRMAEGDAVIALASSGVHSNGFSLVRKVFDIDNNPASLYTPNEELDGKSIAETLLTPTKIYVKSILALLQEVDVKGISHITGGGFYENIPRSIPKGLTAKINKSAVKVLPIFKLIEKTGNIPERDMYNTYNMGVGMSVVVPAAEADKALEILRKNGEDAYIIGEIIKSEDGVIIE